MRSLILAIGFLLIGSNLQAEYHSNINFRMMEPWALEVSHTQARLLCKNERPKYLWVRKKTSYAGGYQVVVHRKYGQRQCKVEVAIEVKKRYGLRSSVKSYIQIQLSNTEHKPGQFACSYNRPSRSLNCNGGYVALVNGYFDNNEVPVYLVEQD